MKPRSDSETILNEFVLHPSWSSWATWIGSWGKFQSLLWPLRTRVLECSSYGVGSRKRQAGMNQHSSLASEAVPSASNEALKRTTQSCTEKDWSCSLLRYTKDTPAKNKNIKEKSKTEGFAEGKSLTWPKGLGTIFLYETSLRISVTWGENRD